MNCECLPGSGMRSGIRLPITKTRTAPAKAPAGPPYFRERRKPRAANNEQRSANSRVLPEPAGDVVFRQLLRRVREDASGGRVLHELAQPEEGGVVRYACRLLHVVRDDHNRIFRLELV